MTSSIVATSHFLFLFPAHALSRRNLPILAFAVGWASFVVWADTHDLLPAWTKAASERIVAATASVTGLLLAFRSNSATASWTSASKGWSNIHATSRSLLRILSVPLLQNPDQDGSSQQALKQEVEALLRMIPAFNLALMHQLQGRTVSLHEPSSGRLDRSVESPDLLRSLLPSSFTHRRARRSTETQETEKPHVEAEVALSQAEEPTRELLLSQNLDGIASLRKRAEAQVDSLGLIEPSNLASDILRAMQASLDGLHNGLVKSQKGQSPSRQEPTLSAPVFGHLIGLLNSCHNDMTELERLRDTPMPALLSAHLHFLLALNLLLLPYIFLPLVPCKLLPLPVVLVTIATFGLHSVSEALNQPFGKNSEKLPMARGCANLLREWRETVGRSQEEAEASNSRTEKIG